MKKIKSYFVALFIMTLGVVFISLPLVIYGSVNPTITITSLPNDNAERGYLQKLVSDVATNLEEDTGFTDEFMIDCSPSSTSGNFVIEVNLQFYKDLGQSAKQDVMNSVLNTISDSNVSRINRVKIYNFVSDLDESTSNMVRQLDTDVRADFGTAYAYWFKPFSGVLGTFLGILCLAIFVFLGVGVAIDLAYITFPAVQYFFSEENKKRYKFVSFEARKSIEYSESSSSNEYKSPTSFYFKVKSKQFIYISICVLYLASGKIYVLIANLMDAFKGIIS